jgi:hypothetical protein
MPQPESEWTSSQKILVRGPDGKLYALSKTGAPEQLTAEEAQLVADIVDEAEERLAEILNDAIPRFNFGRTQMIRVTIPELFLEE